MLRHIQLQHDARLLGIRAELTVTGLWMLYLPMGEEVGPLLYPEAERFLDFLHDREHERTPNQRLVAAG